MSRCTIQVKFCGIFGICTFECNILFTHSNIHSVSGCYRIFFSINADDSRSSNVDHTHFSSLKKISRTQLISCCQYQFFFHRHGTSCNDPVNMAVYQINVILMKNLRKQKFFSKSLSCIMFYVFWGYCCS